jgi:lysine 2,3-aminomutase
VPLVQVKGKMIGRKAFLERFPSLSETIWKSVDQIFPIRITRSFGEKIVHPTDPIGLQVLPHSSELEKDAEDLIDPVGEQQKKIHPWIVEKHKDRALFLLTKRCHLYCRYCFRRTHNGTEDPSKDELEEAIELLNAGNYEEVILSGGDPLAVKEEILEWVLQKLTAPTIRVHTRAPITAPSFVTDQKIRILAQRNSLWVIVHCNHPKELDSSVQQCIQKIHQAGIPILNQTVLLKGVNDNPLILQELCQKLVRLRIFPYYLHHTDFVTGNAHFRVSYLRGRQIYAELSKNISGLALPRYVIDLPDGRGKVDMMTLDSQFFHHVK